MAETSSHVMHEVKSGDAVARPDIPARHQLGFGIQSYPNPAIAPAFAFFICWNVAFLAANKRPNFVALNALAGEITKHLVLIDRARPAKLGKKFQHRVEACSGQPCRCAQTVSLCHTGEDLRAFLRRKLVHAATMLSRASIVNGNF